MYSKNYLNWVKENNISGLTRTQYEFAEFCLSNHKAISVIGNIENIFASTRNWMKNSDKFAPLTGEELQVNLKEKESV